MFPGSPTLPPGSGGAAGGRPGPRHRSRDFSSVLQAPIVGNPPIEGVEALDLVGVVDDVGAVADDRLGGAIPLEAVPNPGRDAHQAVVVLAEEDLLDLAPRRRVLAGVEEDQLDAA